MRKKNPTTMTLLPATGPVDAVAPRSSRPFTDGLVTSLANPKLAIFFVALLPQFVGDRGSVVPTTLLMIALIVMHVLGVAVDWFLTGDNLVKAMLTGRKRLSPEIAAGERKMAPAWRAILLALLSLALVAGLGLSTDYTRTRITLQQTTGQP